MTRSRIRDKLAEVRNMASDRPELSLVTWYVADDPKRYANLSFVRLLVVKDNVIRIMPGTISRGAHNEQYLLFSASGLCRITNGRRRNMVVEPERLRVGENGKETGLVKPLIVGRNDPPKSGLRPSSEKDAALIVRLHEAYEEAVELHEIAFPEAYIRCRNHKNLVLRLSGEATKRLMDLDEYDKRLSMEDNFHNLAKSFAVATEDGYLLYPFDMVQGMGSVLIDTETFPPPLLVPAKAFEDLNDKTARIRL